MKVDASDLAIISVVSVLGFTIIHIALLAFWIDIRNEIRAMRTELKTAIRAELVGEIRAAGVRVSDAELEQARMQGVMSAVQSQARCRARESAGARRNPPADSQDAPPNDNERQPSL